MSPFLQRTFLSQDSLLAAWVLQWPFPMPHSHANHFPTNHARDKRAGELEAFDHEALEIVYKAVCVVPPEDDTRQIAADSMIDAILDKEFGPID